MTRRKRRNHSPEFKAKVVLAALKGDKTQPNLVYGRVEGRRRTLLKCD